ncbi:protein kintoun [Sipha flava]|uniref:Protein kintoun n=1 Tax=Sipha flava TaxID=143950 RepID=A0A8B8GGB3_9HEMI|nr:protein kintoun [Sipha flava]
MSGGQCDLDDLDITAQELDSIGEALKDQQFRKLLCEYVDEINDPVNRAQQEREIEQYERERGTRVTFVRPQPGYVLKTSADGSRKVFVNVCSCDVLDRPVVSRTGGGHHWSLPHCLSPVRQDYDRSRKPCDVYDVVFHPDVLDMVGRGQRLKDMVEDTALSMIEKNNNVVLDRANVKYPKMFFKGVTRSMVIRTKIDGFQQPADNSQGTTELPGCPYKPPEERPIQHHDLGALKQKSLFTVPKFTIKYRSDIDIQEHGYNMHCKMNAVIPKELIIEIQLPLLDSSVNIELDVLPKSLKLVCNKPSKYKLDINLPYTVSEEKGNAKFDKSTKTMIVSLPVVRKEPLFEYPNNLVSEVEMSKEECRENVSDINIVNGHLDSVACNDQNNVNNQESISTNGHHNGNEINHKSITECNSNNNYIIPNDVHYMLPEHEFTFENKYVLTLNVKNVDPTSINVIVINDKQLISGKFHSIGSGFFPIWFAFCLQIPSKSSLFKSDVKVLPSDKNIILEFATNFKPEGKEYWYGLDQDNLTVQYIHMEKCKENSNALANGISIALNDSDDDDDDDDVFDDNKEDVNTKCLRQQNNKKNDGSLLKDKNNKVTTKGKKKKGKKIQKSNAIPIADSLPESVKKMDFIPGSLPVEFNNERPTIRGILKKRALSECSVMDDVLLSPPQTYSSSLDNVDTDSSNILGSSYDLNHKKTVRFNDHVIEKKINFNISIAAQAKKHRQRQQRKRNIREHNTPSESEASEAEDRSYGPLNMVSESEETSVSESSTGEMSDDNSNGPTTLSSKVTVVSDSKKDHKRRKSKSARKNASLAKQASTNNLIFPIEY